MSKASQPELKKFMDKRLFIHLQGGRKISGVLRGFDIFLNLVVDDAVEETVPAEKHPIGQVASGLEPLQAGVTLTQTMSHSIFPPNTGPKLPPDFSSFVIQGPYPPSAPIHLCLSHLQSGPKSNKAVLISSSSKHLSSQLEEYSDLWLHEHAMSGAIAEHLHQTDIFYPPTHKHLRLLLARLRAYSTPSSKVDIKACVSRVPTLLVLHELSGYFLAGDDPEL
ncbi:unnamed protein product [Rhizoctonia solani]|uniref:Small nuclear ribonucleoprotein G n=1 Tax=Rhizoctonia solani TaxID=456999 RepID=A0A8H2WBS3_9AGAM|nr:unnamed protein product [Rhizoctonia solani]